jgi:hypothetical protein
LSKWRRRIIFNQNAEEFEEATNLKVGAMADTLTRDITKADVDKFLFGKHLTSCAVCGRFRSKCDLDVHTLSCQRGETADCSSSSTLNVLMIVCQNCGAIEFHDRTIIAKWLESQKLVPVR